MLQFICAFILSALLLGNAWSACEDQKDKNFLSRISWGIDALDLLKKSDETIRVPYDIENETICYQEKTPLQITLKGISSDEKEYELTPYLVSFKNNSEISTTHYLHVEYDTEETPTHLYVASFLCLGEIPIGADARMRSIQNREESTLDIFISTGEAAGEDYIVGQGRRTRARAFDYFLNVYEERTSTEDVENFNVFIPGILSDMSRDPVSETEKKIMSWFFEMSSSSLNGCSEKFAQAMVDLRPENLLKENSFSNFSMTKNVSGNYKLKIKKAP